MSQPAANAVANLLGKVARYAVLLGVGGSAVQASLYTGQSDIRITFRVIIAVMTSESIDCKVAVDVQLTEVNEQSCMTEFREYCQ